MNPLPHLKPLRPSNGPILDYMRNLPEADQAEITHSLRRLFADGDGAMLLELLENAVDARLVPLESDPRASEYAMVWRFLVSDLKLIARTEHAYQSPMATGVPQRSR
jgi:hypothetical protein